MSLDSFLDAVFEDMGGTWEDALFADELMEAHDVTESEISEAFWHAKQEFAAEALIAERQETR